MAGLRSAIAGGRGAGSGTAAAHPGRPAAGVARRGFRAAENGVSARCRGAARAGAASMKRSWPAPVNPPAPGPVFPGRSAQKRDPHRPVGKRFPSPAHSRFL